MICELCLNKLLLKKYMTKHQNFLCETLLLYISRLLVVCKEEIECHSA
jgi:hypothetical protein